MYKYAIIVTVPSSPPLSLRLFLSFLLLLMFVLFFFYLQILDLFFSISLSLPRPVNSSLSMDVELSYSALTSLEDVIAILRRVSQFSISMFILLFVLSNYSKICFF